MIYLAIGLVDCYTESYLKIFFWVLLQDHFKDLPHHTLSLTKDVHEMKSTHLPSLTKDMQDIKQKMDDLQKLLESLVKSSGQ